MGLTNMLLVVRNILEQKKSDILRLILEEIELRKEKGYELFKDLVAHGAKDEGGRFDEQRKEIYHIQLRIERLNGKLKLIEYALKKRGKVAPVGRGTEKKAPVGRGTEKKSAGR